MSERAPGDVAAFAVLSAVSVALLAARLYAATHIGFGDAEALYASYALHPQPAYLDHPALVGLVAHLVGGGSSPTPFAAHRVTAVVATAFPWLVAIACRASGAPLRRSLVAALVVSVAPEIAVGLFALTPDLLLAVAWTAALACAAVGLRSAPGSGRATLAFAVAGVLAGVSAASKLTGLALFAVLPLAYGAPQARAHARTVAPWAGLTAGALVFAPIVAFEAHVGWPMLRHRLVDSQAQAGVSARNVAALLGGQLVYLSPLIAVLAVLAAREAWRGRGDPVGRLLLASFLVPLVVLVPLCVWSRVAEPHWIAPALLGLVPAAARAQPAARWGRLAAAAVAMGGTMVVAVHAWVLVPGALRLAPASYDPRLDLSNELRGWPEVVGAVRAVGDVPGAGPGEVTVAGPHWVICAQLEVALRGDLPVGCDTPIADDFDTWRPRALWKSAEYVVWVSDPRFGPPVLPTHAPLRSRDVAVVRDGHTVRVVTVTLFARRAQA